MDRMTTDPRCEHETGGALVQCQFQGPAPDGTVFRCVYCNRNVTVAEDMEPPEWCPWGCEHKYGPDNE
jgi:hypothetical protein